MTPRTILVVLSATWIFVIASLPQPAKESSTIFTKVWKYPKIDNPYRNANRSLIAIEEVEACTIVPAESLGYLGWLRGLGCDSVGNLYIWDDAYTAVWKLSPSGNLIWKIKYDSAHN